MGASQSSISPAQNTPGMARIINCSSSASKATPPAVLIASSIGRVATSRSGKALSAGSEPDRIGEVFLRHGLTQQSRFHAFDAQMASQMSGQGFRAARMGNLFEHAPRFAAGQQVEMNNHGTFGGNLVAQRCAKRVDQATFDAGVRDDAFSLPVMRYAG